MILKTTPGDFDTIFEIINDAALAYRDVIPADCWHDPYMTRDTLEHEIKSGVQFYGLIEGETLAGVMGFQAIHDVTLIRHAYVRTALRQHGIGGRLLNHLKSRIQSPILIGTWEAAEWAIHFYQKHGFALVDPQTKNNLLKQYWSISDRQIETSVVLTDHPDLYPKV